MVNARAVVLAPVNAAVYVVKLPFVLVWMVLLFAYQCVRRATVAVVGVPVRYLRRAGSRVKETWKWACYKLMPSPVHACTCAHPRPELTYEGEDEDDLPGQLALRGMPRQRGKQKRALLTLLIKQLLEPMSPVESEDEDEASPNGGAEAQEAAETLRLILDLVKFSNKGDPPSREVVEQLHPEELARLQRYARDRQKYARDTEELQSLITTLDKYSTELDNLQQQQQQQQQQGRRRRREEGGGGRQERAYQEEAAGLPQSYQPARDCNASTPDIETLREEETALRGEFSPFTERSTLSESPESDQQLTDEDIHQEIDQWQYARRLSPVLESPELRTTSTESVNYKELDSALSRLQDETSDLQVNHFALQTLENKILTQEQRPDDSAAVEEVINSSGSQLSLLFEDALEEFPAIPAASPLLGVKEGHDRRNLASARRPRPPTRKMHQGQPPQDEASDNATTVAEDRAEGEGEGEEENSEYSEDDSDFEIEDEAVSGSDVEGGDEGEAPGNLSKVKLGRSPSLPDQIKLLLPGSPSQLRDPERSESEDDSIASSPDEDEDEQERDDPPDEKDVRANSPSVQMQRPSNIVLTRRSSSYSTSSEPGDLPQRPDKSLRIDSSEPPWIAMVEREKPTVVATPSPTAASSPGILPPPHPPRPRAESSSTYDVLPPKPNIPLPSPPPLLSNEAGEGVYDFLQPKKAGLDVIVRGGYLHEKVAAAKPPESYSPQLPPRNSSHIRGSLEEGASRSVGEKEKHRHSRSREHAVHKSRHHHSHSSEERDKGESRRRHRSHSSERERESRSKHSSRSSDKERHRHSRSGERERSSSSHRTRSHSLDKKRSHSSSTRSKESPGAKKRLRTTSSSSSPGSAKKHSTSSSRLSSSSRTGKDATKKRSSSTSSETSPKAKKESSSSIVSKPRGILASLRARASSVKDKSSVVKSKSKEDKVLVRPKSSKSSVGRSTSLTSLRSTDSQGGVSTYSLAVDAKQSEV